MINECHSAYLARQVPWDVFLENFFNFSRLFFYVTGFDLVTYCDIIFLMLNLIKVKFLGGKLPPPLPPPTG